MKDYQPINLAACCNVNGTFLGERMPAVGKQTYHGLPFQIGAANAKPTRKCLIGFHGKGGAKKPITVPIASQARHLIFAHAIYESKIPEGGPVGAVAATYVVRYADGADEIRIPIRERFETGYIPVMWGQLSFLSRPDRSDAMQNRYEGPWENSGHRQTEVSQQWPINYYVWAWRNPHPERKIASITVEPTGMKFVLAGITVSHLEEEPFSRQAMREVKITLPKKADADATFDLDVQIDRGLANYAYPLPDRTPESFLKDPNFRGFGEALNRKSSPAYVQLEGSPSATVTLKSKGKPIAKANWGDIQKKGKLKTPRANFEIIDHGRNWVHVKVVDDATGQPIPCRVHFRSPEGVPFQPHGHHQHLLTNQGSWHKDIGGDLRLGQITYAYIDGKCQGWLPRGRVIVDVARGFEYEPLRTEVNILPGQRDLTLRLKRWTNMNQRCWYSGDTHVHFLGERGAHREAQGEDLNVVHLLQSQWGHLFTNTEDIIGKPSVSDDGKTIVYTTQENRMHLLGHLTLLGVKEPIMPICTDGPGEAEIGGALETTMSRWADECRKQGGYVVLPHIPNPNGEPAAMIATGRVDAVEMLIHGKYNHLEYYRYLNCGYKLPLVGGTDKMMSDVPVGLCRTYVYIPPDEPLTYDNWCKAMKTGRTFLSSGPMLHFTVNGEGIGQTLRLPGNGGTLEIEARAESIFPIASLQIVHNGEVVASTLEKKGARELVLKASIKMDKHSWLAARCAGPDYYKTVPHHDSWSRGLFAHTSPIYIAVGGDWWMFDEATVNYMLTLIDGSVEYIRDHSRQHDHANTTHRHTHKDHPEFLEAPFKEAAEALHRRLHQMKIKH